MAKKNRGKKNKGNKNKQQLKYKDPNQTFGKPRKYTKEELLMQADVYLLSLRHIHKFTKEEVYDLAHIKGFRLQLGVSHSYWYDLPDDYSETKKYIEDTFESHNIKAMQRGVPVTWGIFYFKNKHRYRDTNTELTEEEIAYRSEMNQLKLEQERIRTEEMRKLADSSTSGSSKEEIKERMQILNGLMDDAK